MGFPIAIGTKAVSSYPISSPEPIEQFADDGTVLVPDVIPRDDIEQQQTCFIATDKNQDLQAIITLSYYDMLRLDDGDCEFTLAELRIQIAPLSDPFTSAIQESLHRIRLPCTNEKEYREKRNRNDKNNGTNQLSKPVDDEVASYEKDHVSSWLSPTALFSANQKFLTCLIPHFPFSGKRNRQRRWHGTSDASSVIVFQLQKPATITGYQSNAQQQYPTLPFYMQEYQSTRTDDILFRSTIDVPITTNPRILGLVDKSDGANHALLDACAMCEMATKRENDKADLSFLLIARRNGCVIAASYKPLSVAGSLYETRSDDDVIDNNESKAIVLMDHLTEWCEEGLSIGNLVVLYNDETACIFRSEMKREESDDGRQNQQQNASHLRDVPITSPLKIRSRMKIKGRIASGYTFINLTETHKIPISKKESVDLNNDGSVANMPRKLAAARWISGSYLALAYPTRPDHCTVTVIGLYNRGQSAPICTLETSIEQLIENAHTTYITNTFDERHSLFGDERSPSSQRGQLIATYEQVDDIGISLNYDSATDCIAISGQLCSDDKIKRNFFHFACLWSWKLNAQGLTIVPSQDYRSDNTIKMSNFFFAKDSNFGRKLSHVFSWTKPDGGICVRKEIYNLGVLSPSSYLSVQGGSLRHSNTLFISSKTVCYPWITQQSTKENFEVEWRESIIPKHYISIFGSPRISVIGNTASRSIAIASSRGICILDCSDRLCMDAATPSSFQDYNEALVSTLLKPSISIPRWYRFGNAVHERSFRVLAMSWWENAFMNLDSSCLSLAQADDVLVAVIEVFVGDNPGFHLSCWSSRNLSLSDQLLLDSPNVSRPMSQSAWGINLPPGFIPKCLDLLAQPSKNLEHSWRKTSRNASVLLTDNSRRTRFILYNLQTVECKSQLDITKKKRRHYEIIASQVANNSIGSPADLFLTSTSFVSIPDKHTNSQITNNENLFYSATVGILRRSGGGLDAVQISNNQIIAIGELLPSSETGVVVSRTSEVSRFWLGDIVCDQQISFDGLQLDCFNWILQLADGTLLNWSVPFASRKSDIYFLTRQVGNSSKLVHRRDLSLGNICYAGTTSSWMQQSSSGTRYDFLLGHIPRSLFGCTIGVSQCCKKLHRSLGEDFNKTFFRPDFLDHEVLCPGDFVLYPPAFLPTLYALFHDFIEMHIRYVDNFDYIDAHLKQRLTFNIYQDAYLLSLELLILRTVEQIAAVSNNKSGSTLASAEGMYTALVDAVRKHTTTLQFAALFFKLGRQIEPNCFQYLFPLPLSPAGRPDAIDTIEHLFKTLLEHGSAGMSVTALPLFHESESTKAMCAAVFDYCLHKLDVVPDFDMPITFCTPIEEKNAIGDIFCYSMKLGICEEEDRESYIESEGKDTLYRNEYSFFCVLPRLLRRSSKTEKVASSVQDVTNGVSNICNEIHDLSHLVLNEPCILHPSNGSKSQQSVAIAASRFITSSIFDCRPDESEFCWKKAAAISSLLVSEQNSVCHVCSKADFTTLLKRASFLVIGQREVSHLEIFLKRHIVGCSRQLEPGDAGIILDLARALLGCVAKDIAYETYWLLLLLIIVGDVSGRISDILCDEPTDNPIWTCYVNARFDLSVAR